MRSQVPKAIADDCLARTGKADVFAWVGTNLQSRRPDGFLDATQLREKPFCVGQLLQSQVDLWVIDYRGEAGREPIAAKAATLAIIDDFLSDLEIIENPIR